MSAGPESFARLEIEGWQRVARRYDAAWGDLTRSFVPHLLEAAQAARGDRLLDVACGPGYVAVAARSLGAVPVGVDVSGEMIRVARLRNPEIEFVAGDAQALEFDNGSFDVVTIGFGLPHLPRPSAALEEARRVLKPGGRLAFTVWAAPQDNPAARIVDEAIKAHANLEVGLPPGPDFFRYADEAACREGLAVCGFEPATVTFKTVTETWRVPSAGTVFSSERDAGVRTAALLAAQTPEVLSRIEAQMIAAVQAFAAPGGFAIPCVARVVGAKAP